MLTFNVDVDIKALLREAALQAAREAQAQLPAVDPQVSVPIAAKTLSVYPSTVRRYFDLPLGHPQHLPYVSTSNHAAGRRVLQSDIAAWQQRNRSGQVVPLPVTHAAKRKAK
ncbi:hypothetical protein [Hymenobacter sp. PAMC 26628]|uniref:hypothetical protein n=1 Tax=Hymenobacter sp. PAMC 26628 TaxID=1484118 RepID=UPI00076FE501|nr:hypothetical protein [Hymenobacter sp. PAMC 26628]AMJ67191.1 hypothetical protein AXW84_18470 [Hymenobacter sp. PAMC 26628]